MSEIYQSHDPENEGQARGHQKQHDPELHPVQDLFD